MMSMTISSIQSALTPVLKEKGFSTPCFNYGEFGVIKTLRERPIAIGAFKHPVRDASLGRKKAQRKWHPVGMPPSRGSHPDGMRRFCGVGFLPSDASLTGCCSRGVGTIFNVVEINNIKNGLNPSNSMDLKKKGALTPSNSRGLRRDVKPHIYEGFNGFLSEPKGEALTHISVGQGTQSRRPTYGMRNVFKAVSLAHERPDLSARLSALITCARHFVGRRDCVPCPTLVCERLSAF